jgi:predicted metal-dependent hydrolase
VRLQGDELFCAASEHAIEAAIRHWYQRQARALLAERLAHHAARAGLPLPPLRLSDARTRWGSLSPKGVVSLNWRLIKARPEELDYVICHELAHFRQRNHSAAFWREVTILFPEYLRVRATLRHHGRRYFEF